jgi:hypothetical protein
VCSVCVCVFCVKYVCSVCSVSSLVCVFCVCSDADRCRAHNVFFSSTRGYVWCFRVFVGYGVVVLGCLWCVNVVVFGVRLVVVTGCVFCGMLLCLVLLCLVCV